MVDEHRRIGIAYWVQRKPYWTLARKLDALAGIFPAKVPTIGEALQDKLRHRVYRMRRPGLWDQQRLWPDARIGNRGQGKGNRTGNGEQGIGNSNQVASAQCSRENAAPSQGGGSQELAPPKSGRMRSIWAALARFLGGAK